jgi:hypothetical protein
MVEAIAFMTHLLGPISAMSFQFRTCSQLVMMFKVMNTNIGLHKPSNQQTTSRLRMRRPLHGLEYMLVFHNAPRTLSSAETRALVLSRTHLFMRALHGTVDIARMLGRVMRHVSSTGSIAIIGLLRGCRSLQYRVPKRRRMERVARATTQQPELRALIKKCCWASIAYPECSRARVQWPRGSD